jgi:hypothetical protein
MFFKFTRVGIKIEVAFINLLAIGVLNGQVLIIPVRVSQMIFAFKLKF